MTSPRTDVAVPQPSPIDRLGPDLRELTLAWIWSYRDSPDTRTAYERDIREYLGSWPDGWDPLAVRRKHVDAYAALLSNSPNPRTGRPYAASTIARRLSTVSSWYDYLVSNDVLSTNPAKSVRRPRVDKDHSSTAGLTAAEAAAFRRAAQADPELPCGLALAGFLVDIGARVSEVCAANIDDLGYDTGHRTVTLHMKGGKTRTRAIPPPLILLIDAVIGERTEGPVFTTADGNRLTRFDVARFVRRAAKAAELPGWRQITPHSLRHTWATVARERGASLEERQYALGHADPRTTQRYDRSKVSLDRDPSYLVSAATT